MNITETIKKHERIQELLDRRTRLLEDLQAVDEEIAEEIADLRDEGEAVAPRRALPPAGASRKSGSAKSPKSPKSDGDEGSVRGPILDFLKERRGQDVGTEEVCVATGLEKKQVQNALTHLYHAGKVKRTGRGVYRCK